MDPLIGTRLMLREYTMVDCDGIYRWRNNHRTTVWMGRRSRQAATLEDVRNSLSRIVDCPTEDSRYFAIAERTTGTYIGGIDLTSIDWTDRNAILSVVIASEEMRNLGYGSEALRLILGFAFVELKLHKVSLNVYDKNLPALNCYLKNGFRIEGRIRDHMLINGIYCDLIQMGILDSEFMASC